MTALQALSIQEDAVLECNQRNVNTASPSVTCDHYSASHPRDRSEGWNRNGECFTRELQKRG